MSDAILLDRGDGKIWTITLNRPEALNAITMAMTERLLQILRDAEHDDAARCIVMAANGEAFSAGFDIKEMAGFDEAAMRDAFVRRDPLFKAIALHPLPIIAVLNGKAFGAGALMAAAADFRIATPKTEFKVTAVNYGSANATWSLPRLVGAARAKQILMTGRVVGASEGLAIGLFDELAEANGLKTALELAAQIAAKPESAISNIKRLVNCAIDSPLEEAWQAEFDHVLSQLNLSEQGGNAVFQPFLNRQKT